MNSIFQIPSAKIQAVVKPLVRQKTFVFLIILPVCILLELQTNQTSHFQGFKGLSKAVSWLIINALIWMYMLFLISVARKRLSAYYTSLRILLTDKGIKRINLTDDSATIDENGPGLFFSWNEIRKIKENALGLKILNGKSMLIPGTRQITIPIQIEGYDDLISAIKEKLNT